MSGVAVFRIRVNDEGYWSFMHDRFPDDDAERREWHAMPNVDPGRWFPMPVAAALVAVAEATALVVDAALDMADRQAEFASDEYVEKFAALIHARDRLDAVRAQETPAATIHPPAHYQIDTSTPGWNTRYVDAVAKEHGWTRTEAQGRIADGGAG